MPSQEFTYTGGWQRWNVPKDVEAVEVVVIGAGSGDTRGGRVEGRINVKGRDSLRVYVGQAGTQGGSRTDGGGGAGGNGQGRGNGWSGGGATWIRVNSTTGTIKCVAGGAGGASGDGGPGGMGGGDVAEAGFPGTLGTGAVGNATGGTQIQGGNLGSSSASPDLNGHGAPNSVLGGGGDGGGPGTRGTSGGGGGGGGYHGGGGGQAGLADQTPGGGGGGGSSYRGGLTGYTNTPGDGAAGDGRVVIRWVTPAPKNQPPSPPTEVKVGGNDYADQMPTLSQGKVTIGAKVRDPDDRSGTPPASGKKKAKKPDVVQLVAQYSPDATFRQVKTETSDLVPNDERAQVVLKGLSQNTLWHVRLWTKDKQGLRSTNYTSLKFWTNRAPAAPELLVPGDNATISDLDSVVFGWNHIDPDHPEQPVQRKFNLQWRRAGNPLFKAGPWIEVAYVTPDETYVAERGAHKASTGYEWRVRTQDEQTQWGPWSVLRSFFIAGATAPPWPTVPTGNTAVDASAGVGFEWMFRDPSATGQVTADLRYRAVDTTDWITMTGDTTLPGTTPRWDVPAGWLLPAQWEWEVRTYTSTLAAPSPWSDTETFWVVATPGAVTEVVEPGEYTDARLGCGDNTYHVYRRGGVHYVGQVTPLVSTSWGRVRDDIGTIALDTNGFGSDCAALLRETHAWTHELVVFRDGVRVAEGPITRLTDSPAGFHIEAKDVLGYLYRRIMRQGYNDAYRVVNNVQLGSRSVVERGRQIIMDAMAPDDPNVLEWLTTFDFPNDAKESRSVPDMSKSAWDELDSLAATAGLDYSVIGRRIILNDTHRPIGRLPEMRTVHFSDPPVVSEYGMQLATDFGVTNNNGVYGLATRRDKGDVGPYGLVEMLVSAFGETEGGGTVETMDSQAQAALGLILTEQANRGIASRWPTPLVVRVPDNATLMPDTPVNINHLVPGVWIPLRAQGTVREIAQWQKLDRVTVTQDANGEKVTVTMSPAPNGGEDPDAEGVEGEEG